MDYPSQGLGAKRVAAIVVLVLLAAGLGAGASYYVVGGRSATAAANTVTSTSVSTTTVNAAAPGGGSSAIAIDAVQIYKDSYESVVTVDGFITQSVNTIFGQLTQTGEVLGVVA